MKIAKTVFVALLLSAIAPMSAQTADEVINNYFEKTGGMDAWAKVDGTHIAASVDAGGMEIPVDVYRFKDGRQLVKIDLMGQQITQVAYDGKENMWSTNPMTMETKKAEAEALAAMKTQANDFPSPFFNYKEKGYTAEMVGEETMDDKKVYKIKLTQNPIMKDGAEVPVVSYSYFDVDSKMLVASETEMNGQQMKSTMGNYKEVDGIMFPFEMGMTGQSLEIKSVTINPTLEAKEFSYPE